VGHRKGHYGSGEAYQHDNGRFYLRYYDSTGKRQHHKAQWPDGTPARSEKEARDILKTLQADSIRGVGATNGDGTLRYADVRKLVLEHHRKKDLRSLETLTDGRDSLKGLTELDVYAGFQAKDEEGKYRLTGEPGMKAADLGDGSWDEFVLRRKQEGVGKAVVRSSGKLLRSMLNKAVKKGLISRTNEVFVPSTPEPREDCLYKEDFDRLLGKNGFVDEEYQPLATFLFYQGVRVKETLNIKWSQIDFETGEYRPSKATKTKDTSPKPLKDIVLTTLKRMKGNHYDDEYVFADVRSDGDNVGKRFEGAFRNAMLEMKPVSGFGENRGPAGNAWRCSWCQTIYRDIPAPGPDDKFAPICPSDKDKCKRDRVPLQYHYVGPSPHSLRASCAVYYLEKGLPDSAVMKITGHKSAKVFRGYCRFRTSSVASMMNTPETVNKGKRAARQGTLT